MQMFENKVNTSKKEQNSRALMIERITYKMNFKSSVSSNWLKLTDLEKRSTTIRSVEGPSEQHLISDPVREVVRPVLYKLYPRGAILQVLFFSTRYYRFKSLKSFIPGAIWCSKYWWRRWPLFWQPEFVNMNIVNYWYCIYV